MVDAKLKEYQAVLDENEPNMLLATVSSKGIVSSSIVTPHQAKEYSNVFYVITNSASKRAKNILNHPQVSISTWYNPKKNGNRMSSNNAQAEETSDLKVLEQMKQDNPDMFKTHPNLKESCLITITLKSAVLESFTNPPVIVQFS